jgi:hypothetical protein
MPIGTTPLKINLWVVGLMLFNIVTSLDSNAKTSLIAGEVFPILVRERWMGCAASFAELARECRLRAFGTAQADWPRKDARDPGCNPWIGALTITAVSR